MKKNPAILILISCLLAICYFSSVHAELLIGKIITINHAQQELTMQIVKEQDKTKQDVVVTMADEFKQRWSEGRSFPGCVRIGRIIRVWGKFSSANNFLATDLRGPGLFNDPSGVRNRIGRGCRHGAPRSEEKISVSPDDSLIQ